MRPSSLLNHRSPGGTLLADKVGLGKTIEAGLVLSQKWAERKRRILVITPSNLRKQLGLYELPRRSGDAHLYRFTHPLAQAVVARAKAHHLPPAEVHFDDGRHGRFYGSDIRRADRWRLGGDVAAAD